MTISSGEQFFSGPYAGNGAVLSFDYDFKIYADTELTVTRTNADLTATVLALTVDYTVLGVGQTGGGSILLVAGSRLPTGTTLLITPNVELSQDRRFSSQSSLDLKQIEDMADKLTSLVRYSTGLGERALKVADGASPAGPLPAPMADAVLVWNAAGTALVNGPLGSSISSDMAAAQDAATRAEAALAAIGYRVFSQPGTFTTVAGQAFYPYPPEFDLGAQTPELFYNGLKQSADFFSDATVGGVRGILLAEPAAYSGDKVIYSAGVTDLLGWAGLNKYALSKVSEPIFGFNDGITDTSIYAGASNVSQGLAATNIGGVETLYYLSRVAGTGTFTGDEMFRIAFQTTPGVGTPTALTGFTAPLQLGHQGLSAYTVGSQVKLVTQLVVQPGHTGLDAGKGFSVINWQGAGTVQGDVTSYQLFGYSGSGHRYARFNSATPAVSSDGKWLVLVARNARVVDADELDEIQDTTNWLFVYDLAEVLAAVDPLTVSPRFQSQIKPPNLGERMQYTQAVACDDHSVWINRGYSNPRGRHLLMQYDFQGNLLGEYDTDGSRAPYTVADMEGAGALGVATSFEPEGLALRPDGSLLWLAMDEWRLAGDVVSFEGSNYACRSATSSASPRHELFWVKTTLAASGPWVSGTSYAPGNRSRKSKTVYCIAPATGAVGEYPMSSGKNLPPSGASYSSGSNPVDVSYRFGDTFQVNGYSENTGAFYNAFEYSGGRTLGLYDGKEGSNNTIRATIGVDFSPTREIMLLRAKGDAASGAGINLYGLLDGVNPDSIFFYTGGAPNIKITPAALVSDLPITGTGVRQAGGDALPTLGQVLTVSQDTSLIYKGRLSAAGALDATWEPGVYRVNSSTDAITVGAPGTVSGGIFEILRAGSTGAGRNNTGDNVERYTMRSDADLFPRVWMRRATAGGVKGTWVEFTNTRTIPPGPFANDTAAAAGGVLVGQFYRQPAGATVWRQV